MDIESDEDQNEIRLLKSERNRLEAELHKQTLQLSKHKQQQIIPRHEITPKYIVPDTNCFLSHLELIQNIYVTTFLQLIVPLIGKRIVVLKIDFIIVVVVVVLSVTRIATFT